MGTKTKKGARKCDDSLKEIGHEIRMDILRICGERLASPIEVATETGQNLSQVSYHFKILQGKGTIQLVKIEPRRGAIEHYYRAMVPAMLDDKTWSRMPMKQRLVVYRTILQAMFAEGAAAEAKGAFAADDAHLSWVPFPADDLGREELTAVLAEALEAIERVKATTAERLAESGETGQEIVGAIMGYERAPAPGKS